MHWERIKQQLERILHTELCEEDIALSAWTRHAIDQEAPLLSGRIIDEQYYIGLYKTHNTVYTWRMDPDAVSVPMRQVVELMLDVQRAHDAHLPRQTERERHIEKLQTWLMEQWDEGRKQAELPSVLVTSLGLQPRKVPLLLDGGEGESREAQRDLEKLLETFFEGDALIVPLQHQWLVLADETLIQQQEEGEEESNEDLLLSLASGLHEMLATEWIAECRIAVLAPIDAGKQLLQAATELKQTMQLGRKYQIAQPVYPAWTMQLERLLDPLPNEAKLAFIRQVFAHSGNVIDQEMITTLEQFLASGCSVSDTAKKLFIHRNTLLYRLDKFKQETGLDVRTFRHAVLVELALLLYKVTKRG